MKEIEDIVGDISDGIGIQTFGRETWERHGAVLGKGLNEVKHREITLSEIIGGVKHISCSECKGLNGLKSVLIKETRVKTAGGTLAGRMPTALANRLLEPG